MSQFIIADPGLCIGCRTCMAACIEKHDVEGDVPVARLNLVTTLAISAPIVCHHCADAPCVDVCPENALFFDGERVGVRDGYCIGCRSCMMACPYGAVDITVSTAPRKFGNLVIGERPKANVIKCDLCHDRVEGPACVSACLTHGLRLVDEADLKVDMKDKRKTAAMSSGNLSSFPLNPALV